jgi:ABC-type amino acid transport substrate-binding protein
MGKRLKSLTIGIFVLIPALLSDKVIVFAGKTEDRPKNLPTLIVGYNHVPPDSLHINGQPAGPAYEFLQQIAPRMGVRFTYQYLPLSRLLAKINSNQIDMILRIGANPALPVKPTAPFTYTTPGILLARRLGIKTWKELAAKPAIRIGTKGGMPLTDTMKTILDRISYQPGDDALAISLRMVQRGRLEGVYSPTIGELVYMASEMKILDDFVAIRLPDPPWNVYAAFSRQAHEAYHRRYIEALTEIQRSQPYQSLYESYIRKHLPGIPKDVIKVLLRDELKP